MNAIESDWRDKLGFVGVVIAVFFGWFGPAGLYIGMALALVGFAADFRSWKAAWCNPVILTVGAFAAWIVFRTALAVLKDELPGADHFEAAGDWLMLLLFPVFAWWLRGNPERVELTWIVAMIAMTVGLLSSLDADVLQMLIDGGRYGFHLKKPVALSLYLAALLLGLLILAPRWSRSEKSWERVFWVGCFVLLFCVLLLAFLAMQSRGVLLAVALVWPVALYVRYKKRLSSWKLWVFGMLFVLGVGLIAKEQFAAFGHRVTSDSESLRALVEMDLRAAPSTAAGYRLRLWSFGFEQWQRQPFIGFGPDASRPLVAESNDLSLTDGEGKFFDHLHSTYLELLVRLGVPGFVFMFALIVLLFRSLYAARSLGGWPIDLSVWLAASLAIVLIYSLTDFRVLHYDWRLFWWLLAGSMFSFEMHRRLPERCVRLTR